jgi:hypothetical protein
MPDMIAGRRLRGLRRFPVREEGLAIGRMAGFDLAPALDLGDDVGGLHVAADVARGRPQRAGQARDEREAGGRVGEDDLTLLAAALTYYGILSLFPGLLVLLALLGLAGTDTIDTLLKNLGSLTPTATRDVVTNAVRDLQRAGVTPQGGRRSRLRAWCR